MFDLNNDTSTLLLLVVLGLLIWYITKPSCSNEKFTIDDKISSISEPVETIPVSQMMINNSQTGMLSATNEVALETPIVNQVATVNQVASDNNVNVFGGFEGNDDFGAEIDKAFDAYVPTANTSVSAVDINKSNVQNYDAKDFLPKEINDQWFDTDFSQAKTNIADDKLINTDRFVIGINTVGQSLKNASYDIRGTIANPKFSVSPWNNSTYEPDYNIKPLC